MYHGLSFAYIPPYMMPNPHHWLSYEYLIFPCGMNELCNILPHSSFSGYYESKGVALLYYCRHVQPKPTCSLGC